MTLLEFAKNARAQNLATSDVDAHVTLEIVMQLAGAEGHEAVMREIRLQGALASAGMSQASALTELGLVAAVMAGWLDDALGLKPGGDDV